jgi:hypothetical protein
MTDIRKVEMTAEKSYKLDDIYNNTIHFLNKEIEKMTPDTTERIIFNHIIITAMYELDKNALEKMGIKIQ